MSSDSSFEMYEMLLERQSIIRSERLTLKASLDVLDIKIKSLIARVKNRPRESDEELVKRLNDVEVFHDTHPQTNKDEREFMRELKVLKTKRKELVEFNVIQGEIDELKSKRSFYQGELKEKEACLDELYAGARKMRAAHKLKCDPNILQEETMIIPQDKFRLVIGAAGANIKKLEDECFVCIDMDRGRADAAEGKLKLFYDSANNNVEEAKRLIQVILDTRIEEWSLTNEKITCLLNKRAAIVMKLQDVYDVRIDISKAKLLCKVSGLSSNVEKVMQAINLLEVSTSRVDLAERRVLSHLLGRGRPAFQSLLEEHSVDVQLDKDSDPPIATVVGAKGSVVAVTAALKLIVEENKEIVEELTFEKHVVLDAVIGAKGSIISQLQRDFNVRLTVDKDKSTAESAIIEIRGNNLNVKAVKEHIASRINDYQSDTAIISVPEGLLAGILGKKGSRISALRQKHPAVTIDVSAETFSIRLHCTEPSQRLAAVHEVEQYIAANMQKDFVMLKSTTITLKGGQGAEARAHLIESLQLKLDIDTEREVVHIRGRIPDIEKGILYLTAFCEDNCEVELQCDADDAASLLNGKEESPQRTTESQFGIKIYFSRKSNVFRLVGHRDAVHDAKQHLVDFLEGRGETSALVAITPAGIGAFVGRGGSHIKSFEKKHSVRVDILKPRGQVRVQGTTAEAVAAAKVDLLGFLDSLMVNVTVEGLDEAWAGRSADCSAESLDELFNQAKTMFGVSLNKVEKAVSKEADVDDTEAEVSKMLTVTFFGTPRCASAARDYVLDEISGTTTALLPVLPHHVEMLSSPVNMTKLEQSASSANVVASLTESDIVLTGPIAFMSKAKIQVNRLLDFLFTGEFSSVIADSRTLLALWNFETECDFNNQVVGGQIAFDLRMSCIRVVASTSISHTLGVEYIRSAIAKCKLRVAVVEVSADVFGVISAKKSVYFGPIETKFKCRVTTQISLVKSDSNEEEDSKQYEIVIQGPSEKAAKEAETALRTVIHRLEKENWKIILKSDLVGALVGKGGKNVSALREETKANINIDMRSGSVEVTGKEDHVTDAKERILKFVADKERESHVTYVPVTPDCLARIIGVKGATIRELRISTKAGAIDINREENVIVVTGTVESGQQAREEITALLLKDNIDISKLRYITPEERKAAAVKKAEADKAAAKKEQQQGAAASTSKARTQAPVAGSKESYYALLNTPGISKTSVRRIKRKMRETEESQQGGQAHQETDEKEEGEEEEEEEEVEVEPVHHVAAPSSPATPSRAGEDHEQAKFKLSGASKATSPSSIVEPASSFKMSSVLPPSAPAPAPPLTAPRPVLSVHVPAVAAAQHKPKVAVPSGTAGSLLSMILGDTPVTSSTNRLCSPRSMGIGGFKHGAVGSVQRPPLTARAGASASAGAGAGSVEELTGSNYYMSKTGRAIRLD